MAFASLASASSDRSDDTMGQSMLWVCRRVKCDCDAPRCLVMFVVMLIGSLENQLAVLTRARMAALIGGESLAQAVTI